MATLSRIRVALTGSAVVGPSVSTFYAEGSVSTAVSALRSFYDSIKTALPTGLNVQVANSGDDIDDAAGTLIGTWSSSPAPALVTGTGSGQWAEGVGARVVWNTSGIYRGRRVRGSTFIVPLVSAAFEGGGGLVAATQAQIQSAATALIAAAPTLVIYSRTTGGTPGESNAIQSATVPDQVSWLRSRRT